MLSLSVSSLWKGRDRLVCMCVFARVRVLCGALQGWMLLPRWASSSAETEARMWATQEAHPLASLFSPSRPSGFLFLSFLLCLGCPLPSSLYSLCLTESPLTYHMQLFDFCCLLLPVPLVVFFKQHKKVGLSSLLLQSMLLDNTQNVSAWAFLPFGFGVVKPKWFKKPVGSWEFQNHLSMCAKL